MGVAARILLPGIDDVREDEHVAEPMPKSLLSLLLLVRNCIIDGIDHKEEINEDEGDYQFDHDCVCGCCCGLNAVLDLHLTRTLTLLPLHSPLEFALSLAIPQPPA